MLRVCGRSWWTLSKKGSGRRSSRASEGEIGGRGGARKRTLMKRRGGRGVDRSGGGWTRGEDNGYVQEKHKGSSVRLDEIEASAGER